MSHCLYGCVIILSSLFCHRHQRHFIITWIASWHRRLRCHLCCCRVDTGVLSFLLPSFVSSFLSCNLPKIWVRTKTDGPWPALRNACQRTCFGEFDPLLNLSTWVFFAKEVFRRPSLAPKEAPGRGNQHAPIGSVIAPLGAEILTMVHNATPPRVEALGKFLQREHFRGHCWHIKKLLVAAIKMHH